MGAYLVLKVVEEKGYIIEVIDRREIVHLLHSSRPIPSILGFVQPQLGARFQCFPLVRRFVCRWEDFPEPGVTVRLQFLLVGPLVDSSFCHVREVAKRGVCDPGGGRIQLVSGLIPAWACRLAARGLLRPAGERQFPLDLTLRP